MAKVTFALPTLIDCDGMRYAAALKVIFSKMVRQTQPQPQPQLSTPWRLGCSAAAALIICFAGLNLFLTSTPKVEWIHLPSPELIGERSGLAIRSSHDGSRDYRFGQAFADPKQPIFTRIEAISPALVALPAAEQDKGPETIVAIQTEPEDLAEINRAENSVEDLSPDATPSYNFAGVWAPTAHACSPKANSRDFLPAVINHDGAWAGEVSCRFRSIKQSGSVAVVTSTCSDGRRRWTSNVRLAVVGDRLKWSSERGSQTYVRCSPRIVEARATI
jgi:hypothetical protein